jgi:general nucleoside transport system permease protein
MAVARQEQAAPVPVDERSAARFDRFERWGEILLSPAVGVLLGLAVGSIAVLLSGHSVVQAYTALVQGVTATTYSLSTWLERATPIVFAALGTAVAFRAGLINLGGVGQLICGALAAALVGLALPFHGPLNIVLSLAAGTAAGALAGWLPGLLEARLGVTLLVSTLLLNYLFEFFFSYLVAFPLRDRTGTGALPQTRMLPPADRLTPLAAGTRFNLGMVLMALVAVGVALAMRRTVWGYELRMRGLNPSFAHVGGVNLKRQTSRIMVISGALVGLGGAIATLATFGRYIDGALTVPLVAWTGLVAALMAGSAPLGAAAAGLLLAFLQTGASAMSVRTGVPLELANIIQGTIIIFVSARVGFGFWLAAAQRRRRGS